MGFAIAGGIALAGGLSYLGSQQSAQAAGNAAQAQAAQASANRSTVMQLLGYNNQGQLTGQGAMGLAQATPQELNILGQQYNVASQNLQQQQQLMNSINPSLMSASQQAYQLLQGGTAASTTGVMQMRNQQRQQLVNSLQSQYGPGAESTSVGQQALNNFDMQTNSMQMGMMNNLFGIASNGAPQQNLMTGMQGMQSVGAGYSALQNRQLNAQMAGMGDIMGVGNQMLQTAGAPYVQSALQGQGLSQLGNLGMQGAGMYAGYAGMQNFGTGGAGYSAPAFSGQTGTMFDNSNPWASANPP